MEEKTISFKKHKEFGMMCKILNVRLVEMGIKLNNNEKTKKAGRAKAYHHIQADKALSSLKNHMEEIMFNEYPGKATTNIYYGKP